MIISNEGDVIPPDKIKHIFDKFYQGDTSHITEGNGFGLAVVKTIIQLHNGIIKVSSSTEETAFEVKL